MENEQTPAPEEKRVSAAELKAQIEEKQRELKVESQTPASEPAPQDQAPKVELVSQDKPQEPAPSEQAVDPSTDDKAIEAEKFAQKKGWKDYEALIESYRNLEKKLGERSPQIPAPQMPPSQVYPNPAFYGAPPVPPAISPNAASQIARLYPQIPPEDIERLAPLIVDLSESIASRKYQELERQIVKTERQRQRDQEIESLKRDPAFQNDEVKGELGQILERDPRLIETDNGLTLAFNQALANVGRKRLEGSVPEPKQKPNLNTTPPTTARGTGPANVSRPGIHSPTQLSPENFSSLPLEEKKRALRAIGAIRD